MYKPYSGSDKYHFRVYKSSGHPVLVVATKQIEVDGKVYISGYVVTHSLTRVLDKPGCYVRLKNNPNPKDDRPSYINKYRISNLPANRFTKPYTTWHLSKEDEMIIDILEKKYAK